MSSLSATKTKNESSYLQPARACPACGQAKALNRGLKNDFQILACSSCATVYTSRLPDAEQSQDYDGYYTAENLTVPEVVETRLGEIIATFEAYRKNDRLLDVGCGAGTFLEAARRGGWRPSGVDVSHSAAEYVRSLGFEIFCGELERAKYPEDYFDVVIASEVLEHIPDPRGMLDGIARVLRPGGLLWATTPHARGISAGMLGLEWTVVCPPEHLQLFSREGIRRMLSDAGFRNITLATHGMNPFEILHSWLHSPAAQASDSVGGAQAFDRVESTYHLGQFLSGGPSRRLLKRALYGGLSLAGLGDYLKVRAEK